MAKKALLDVLEQTIGKYVKNLDAESLNVAVWSGKIELHALELDCDSVNAELSRQAAEAPNLAIPLRVISGQFSSFEVDVPWAQLMSRPVILRARGLTVEVEPFDRTANADFLHAVAENEAVRTRLIQDARVQSITSADEYRQRSNTLRKLAEQDLEAADPTKSSSKKAASSNTNASFGARLARRIIENIQVEISDVHVCLKGAEYEAGLDLESLQLVTTDKNGQRTFVDRTSGSKGLENSFLYKALKIQGLGIYLDEDETRHSRLNSIQEESSGAGQHSYVLAPLSFEAKLRQADSNICVEFPKYLLVSELSSLAVLLSKTQMELGNKIAQAIKPSDDVARPLFPEYRPLARVTKETAKDWWRYAVRCVGRLNGRRSWAEFYLAFQEGKKYIPIYKRHAHHAACSWLKPLTPAEQAELEKLERNRTISVEGLMTWRNIADAQMEKEKEKYDEKLASEKGSLFTSLFGTSKKTESKTPKEEEPPIALSMEEMRELATLSLEQVTDNELSNDSRLCDIKFTLGSFRVNLTSYDLRPIADLQMGTVSTAFDASADGSFAFDFALTSLEITDMVTAKSFFPSVLKNQNISQSPGISDAAFSMHVGKTKSGDQHLDVKLSTFEAVASPVLFLELKRLFSLSPLPSSQKSTTQNPLLAQSVSGSVDLFYDATEGAMDYFVEPLGVPERHAVVVGDYSEALIDAWKSKTETQAAWMIELDIQAPIIIVPENCTESRANVLMFDLGHLKLQYGKIGTVPKVKEWFRNNPRHPSDNVDPVLDNASLKINNLTFMIGRANYWHRMVRKHEMTDPDEEEDDDAIVNPISLSVDLGIESRVKEDVPRVCTFGVLPSISLSISPSQLSRILAISKAWMKVSKDIFPASPNTVPVEDDDDNMSTSSAPDRILQFVEQARRYSVLFSGLPQQQPFVRVHADMRLQKLSLKILTDAGNGMEAHLVSVFASLSTLSDGSTSSKLSMGWFWILDRFENEFPRRQRLVAHSSLPISPEALSEGDKYDILGELERIGAFNEDFGGSTDLADISFQQSGDKTFGTLDPFMPDSLVGNEYSVDSILDAKFTSLYVNWNPQAVKTITEMTGRFVHYLDNPINAKAGSLIVSSPTQLQPRRPSFSSKGSQEKHQELKAAGTTSVMLIRAAMDSFEISLNSARDDFPLFLLKMSRTVVSLVSSSDHTMKMSLGLGDLSVSTPAMGRTDPLYRTILGLAPGRSESLLSVTYCEGMKAMETMDLEAINLNEYEACAQVELSPMRMVYVQAQVLALVEYATAGILGALASQAASSAAVAATEIATSIGAKKFFSVKATGFEVVLPQAAYLSTYISVRTGALQVDYVALPEPGGGQATLTLSDVVLTDDRGSQMQEEPIGMSINVGLPPADVGTKEDQAMRVGLDISKASFLFSKRQYAQILSTLDLNIGDPDLCLRESSAESVFEGIPSESDSTGFVAGLTHAGVAMVDNPGRIYVDVHIIALSLELCAASDEEPIVRLAAMEADISLKMLPDEDKMTCQVSLRDLICDDRRLKAIGRQYRSLIYQDDQKAAGATQQTTQNLFLVSYEANQNGSSTVDLNIGSPRLVLIPDVVSEVLVFLDVPRQQSKPQQAKTSPEHENSSQREVVEVEASQSQDAFEAAFVLKSEKADTLEFATLSLAVKTAQCSIILVDLGSDSLLPAKRSPLSSATVSSVAETIVLSGTFSANVSLDSSSQTGELMNVQAQIHGDELEAYTAFGRDLNSPLQILDPVNFSVYFTSKTVDDTGAIARSVDLRAAALTPLDISLSMRNVALVNAILSSISECFDDGNENQVIEHDRFLSQQETVRIENLASALSTEDPNPSFHSHDSSGIADPSTLSVTGHDTADVSSVISIKLTMPETKVTLINDLQGLDEALLRITIRNLVAGGQARVGERLGVGSSQFTGFDLNVHTSVLADYFDASSNDWEVLLLRPWEATLKAGRSANLKSQPFRPSTAIDVESFPCHMSFSEQFLMSLASANRMWSVYSTATSSVLDSVGPTSEVGELSNQKRKSMAATAARTFITSLPYALDNHSGVPVGFLVHGELADLRTCETGSIEYFQFEPPPGNGSGGKRLYGRDVAFAKSISVFVGDSAIELTNLDGKLGFPTRAHELQTGQVFMTQIVKEGKTIVLHISSGVDLRNRTSIPFSISTMESSIGICEGSNSRLSSVVVRDGFMSKPSRSLGVPITFVDTFRASWAAHDEAVLSLVVSPRIPGIPDDVVLQGSLFLKPDRARLSRAKGSTVVDRIDITCRPVSLVEGTDARAHHGTDALVLRACITTVLIDEKHPHVEISLEPRATVENKMPVAISVRSPMPHIFSSPAGNAESDHNVQPNSSMEVFGGESVHRLQPDSFMEVFTPGPSIAVKIKCTDNPVGGSTTDWMEGGWVDLPLLSEFSVPEPLRCVFPFVRKVNDPLSLAGSRGSEFFIAEGNGALSELSIEGSSANPKEGERTSTESSGVEVIAPSESQDDRTAFVVTVCNYAVDHTGDILFEQLQGSSGAQLRRSNTDIDKSLKYSSAQVSAPFGAFGSRKHRGRISLLPGSNVPIRLLHLTMDGDEGLKKSTPFRVEEVSICDGGVEATPLCWEDGAPSGYYAYRKLVSPYQSEIHVIPEYIVFNGSEQHQVRVRQPGGAELIIAPRQVAPLRTQLGETPIITVEYVSIGARTPPLRVDSLGLRVAIVKSPDGIPVGSLAVQTVVGAQDSRLVIKLGEIKHGSLAVPEEHPGTSSGLLDNDFMRFRVHWSELRLTLKEARPIADKSRGFFESAIHRIRKAAPSPNSDRRIPADHRPRLSNQEQGVQEVEERPDEDGMLSVCTLSLQRFTVDWQRVFKDEVPSERKSIKEALLSPERSQLSVIIHHVQLRDDTPGSPFPVVFDSTSEVSFFDLCIRCRGSPSAEMVKVDLFDLNLAHANGISKHIVMSTSEDFIWKLLDLGDRILAAAREFAGVNIELKWDEEHDGYVVSIRDRHSSYIGDETKYTPPQSDQLYHITKARVSPFNIITSFTRNPQSSRYKKMSGVPGANLMNYFTRRLKFKIDKAELKFARYEANNIKGPPDRLAELIATVYVSRMKLKLVTIITAASFQDWKFLSSRDGGDDEFVEGDLLRVTGNMAGNTAGYVLKKAGTGLGKGVSRATNSLGDGIESASGAIGARHVGAGINSLVSGVGDGVGDTLTGVGTGAGKVFKGAGQGVGHLFGGVSGGALLITKGVGKGITTGDGRAVVSGITQGVASVGNGVGQGVESVVTGAAGGVYSVGMGLFSGVKSVGKGIGGAFVGKKAAKKLGKNR